VADYIEKFQTL